MPFISRGPMLSLSLFVALTSCASKERSSSDGVGSRANSAASLPVAQGRAAQVGDSFVRKVKSSKPVQRFDSPSLEQRWFEEQQATGGPEYHARVDAMGVVRVHNPSARVHAEFDRRGMKLTGDLAASAPVSVSIERVGCETSGTHLALSENDAVVDEHRVTREWGRGVQEWFLNGPLGLEQGFTVDGDPGCEDGRLEIRLNVQGRQAALDADRRSARFKGEDAQSADITYQGLRAFDSTGRALTAELVLQGAERLAMRVDTTGAQWPVVVDPTWGQQAKLLASDGTTSDGFGSSVSLQGQTAVVGSPGNNSSIGSAYVYVKNGNIWTQQAKLVASDGAGGDSFGASVSLSGDTALIGAYLDEDAGHDSGSAYVFVRNGTSWTQQAKLVANDGGALDYSGLSVSLSGDTAVVSSYLNEGVANNSGAAYVFVRSGATWSQQAKLTASDGVAQELFGVSVAVSGDTTVIGTAPFNGFHPGSAYVFVRNGTSWTQQAKLTASDGVNGDQFGASASLQGDTAVIGSTGDDASRGSAYVFVRSGSIWSEQAKLIASDRQSGDRFGSSVSFSGNTALIGASQADSIGVDSGAAYLFVRVGTTWSQQNKIYAASDGAAGDAFGSSVALDGTLLAVGAPGDDDSGSNSGSASIWTPLVQGSACSAPADCPSGFCVDGVCCDTSCIGTCEACSVAKGASIDGSCALVADGVDPSSECGVMGVGDCQADGVCNGAGACRAQSFELECSPLSCLDSFTVHQAASCTALGICPAAAEEFCNGYLCESGQCLTSCSNSSPCAPGFTCSPQNTCVDGNLKPQGDACTTSSSCASGFCVDHVCCEAACTEICQACSAALTGQLNGLCRFATAGQADASCPTDPPCGADGMCDGAGACRAFATNSQKCGDTSCVGAQVQGLLCDGQGQCASQPPTTCSDGYVCSAGECPASCVDDSQCDNTHFCNGTSCVPRQMNGLSCNAGSECATGFCVDSVCCSSACDGTCQSCDGDFNTEGSGKCSPVRIGDDPRSDCAKDTSNSCGAPGTCDGAGDCQAFAAMGATCGAKSCDGALVLAKECDGSGDCGTVTDSNCVAFKCDPVSLSCNTTCVTSAECASGAVCGSNGSCSLGEASCQDASTAKAPDGTLSDCSPYRCLNGQCKSSCSTAADCAPGSDCTVGQCVSGSTGGSSGASGTAGNGGTSGAAGASNSVPAASDDGGCSMPRGRTPSGSGILLLAAVASAVARRRRVG